MASLVGFIAGVVATCAAAFACATILYLAGINSPPKWALFGITGVSLSLGVTAFREAQKFALTRPRLRHEAGRMALFLIGAGILYGGYEIFNWKSETDLQQALQAAQAQIARQLPKSIDANTTLIATSVNGGKWSYTYSLTGGPFDTVALEKGVRRNFCASNMKEWVSKGVPFIFEYQDKAGSLLAVFQVTSCP